MSTTVIVLEQNKKTKKEVNYSMGMKKSHCGICKYYNDYSCTKVRGIITPSMWCKLFKPMEK